MRWRVRESRTGGGGRQAEGVDIVLHRDGHAEQRQRAAILRAQAFGLRERVLLVAQADEDGGIVVLADALVAACDRLGGREPACAMRGDAAIRGGPDAVRSDGPLLERDDFSSIVISLYLFV